MPQGSTRIARIEAWITPETLVVVKRAAELQGRSVSDLVAAAAHVTGSIAGRELATLNHTINGQGAFIGVIDQFEVMPIVSPLVLFLRRRQLAN